MREERRVTRDEGREINGECFSIFIGEAGGGVEASVVMYVTLLLQIMS